MHGDVRWVAATNRDLGAMIANGTFREDLYHRLAVFPVELPSLRDRRDDIVPLAEQLLARSAAELGRSGLAMSESVRETLRDAPWTGNVRELRNTLERAVILTDGTLIDSAHLVLDPRSLAVHAAPAALRTLDEIERDAIMATLSAVGGNRKDAAERLGIGVRTLYERLKRYGEDD